MADEIITGNQSVTGNQLVTGNSSITGDLTIHGVSTILGENIVEGNELVKGNLTVEGNQTIIGTQTVIGQNITNQTINSSQTISGTQVITDDQVINNNQTILGDQTVIGNQVITKGIKNLADQEIFGKLDAKSTVMIGGTAYTKKLKFVKEFSSTLENSIGVSVLPDQNPTNYTLTLPRIEPNQRSLLVANPTVDAHIFKLEWVRALSSGASMRDVFFEDFWSSGPWIQRFSTSTETRVVSELNPQAILSSAKYLGLCEIKANGNLQIGNQEPISLTRMAPTIISFRVHPNLEATPVGDCFFGIFGIVGFTFEYTSGTTIVFDIETNTNATVQSPTLVMIASGSTQKFKIDKRFYNLNLAIANDQIVLKIDAVEIATIPFSLASPVNNQITTKIGARSTGLSFYLDLIKISQLTNLDDTNFPSLGMF